MVSLIISILFLWCISKFIGASKEFDDERINESAASFLTQLLSISGLEIELFPVGSYTNDDYNH